MPEYSLVEIFRSFQGEGRNTGRQVVFVRFAGCNLACPWCDTDKSPRFRLGLDALVAEVEAFGVRSVILTGGEPTQVERLAELVAALKAAGFWIGVETNGTGEPGWLQFVDYVAVSPKLEYAERTVLKAADEVRVVASGEERAVVAFCRQMREKIAATDYYVSPCDLGGNIDFATAKAVLAQLPGWSLSVQLHKLLGFR